MSNSRLSKDRLSVCRILSIQRKPKLGLTKLLTGPHAARGLDIVGLGKLLDGVLNSWKVNLVPYHD